MDCKYFRHVRSLGGTRIQPHLHRSEMYYNTYSEYFSIIFFCYCQLIADLDETLSFYQLIMDSDECLTYYITRIIGILLLYYIVALHLVLN